MLAHQSQTHKPPVDLADTQDDCFRAMLRIAVALDRNGQIEQASSFWRQARTLKRYDQVVRMASELVEVTS
jgi:hypothetical protein